MIGTEKALHQHIQAYGMWTHWWAHTYGAGGFCCFAWEEGTVLAFDQTPNHRAQHTEYSLKISNCLWLHHFVSLFKKKNQMQVPLACSSLQMLSTWNHRIKKTLTKHSNFSQQSVNKCTILWYYLLFSPPGNSFQSPYSIC